MLRIASRIAALAVAASLAACGGDSGTSPSPTTVQNFPSVAGTYSVSWTTQYNRTRDNYNGQFLCYGQITITQEGNVGTFKGFSVINSNCPASTADLTGTVSAGGEVVFTTAGPKPSGGPCPVPPATSFTGGFTTSGSSMQISARGVAKVNCPGDLEGEYVFTQLVSASRYRG